MRATLGALLVLVTLVAPVHEVDSAADPAPISFVADAAVSRNTATPWIVVPSAVQPGDRLVLLLSMNVAGHQVSSPSGVSSWSLEGDRTARTMRTLVWSKVAEPGDAGSRLDITLSGGAKSTVHVAAYRGVAPGALTVVSSAWTTTSTVRTTPLAPATDASLALSFWASKSASTTAWAPPPEVTPRTPAGNLGSGRIVSLLADSGTPVAAGDYGGLAAVSDQTSKAATTWTVVLPSVLDQEPTPSFSHECLGLVCSFDATDSSAAAGSLTSYNWTFGDGTSGTGLTVTHTYPATGSYEVVLTVIDQDGASATTTEAVVVTAPAPGGVVEVTADVETDPVLNAGDAADDPTIWVHPTVPGQSLVIGNDKLGALEVYDLDGTRIQRIRTTTSFWGNVDVRQDVTIAGTTLDVVIGYNTGLRTFAVDPASRRLEPVGDGTGAIPTNGGEGLCAYHPAASGDLYVFVITRAGRVRQYRIHDSDGDGLLQGTMVREFIVGSEAEGCFADDDAELLYVAEEDVGLWRYGAEATDGTTRTLVDSVAPGGNLAYDVEGVTMAETGPVTGYLLVSAQNGAQPDRSYFAVYDRGTNAYLGSFRVAGGAAADGCERTDGITAHSGDLGPDFPAGVFVCQDNGNTIPAAGYQNFKLTRLEKIFPDIRPGTNDGDRQ